jgi:hypothetical protein
VLLGAAAASVTLARMDSGSARDSDTGPSLRSLLTVATSLRSESRHVLTRDST